MERNNKEKRMNSIPELKHHSKLKTIVTRERTVREGRKEKTEAKENTKLNKGTIIINNKSKVGGQVMSPQNENIVK